MAASGARTRRQGRRLLPRLKLEQLAVGAALLVAIGLRQDAAAFASPSTPSSVSSFINPAIDRCTADPAGWVKGPVPAPESVTKILSAKHNATFLWGTYQPNQYFGVKSRTAPATLASGILWHGAGFSVEQARSECRQEDRIRKYGWTQHDGRSYGRQVIDDAVQKIKLTTEYARLDVEEGSSDGRYWATRVYAEPAMVESADVDEDEDKDEDGGRLGSSGDRAAVYLYLAVDCDGSVPAHACLEAAGGRGLDLQIDRNPGLAAAFIRGRTKDLGDFTLEVGISPAACSSGGSKRKQAPLSVSYWGGSGVLLADLKSRLEGEARRLKAAGAVDEAKSSRAGKRRTAVALPDVVPAGSNVVVLRVAAPGRFTVDAVLRRTTPEELAAVAEEDEDYEPGTEDVGKIKALVDSATAQGLQRFQSRFDRVFALSQSKGYKGRPFTPAEIEAAQAAFSNMIGGVGYFQGRTSIKAGDERGGVLESFPTQLFTAVPSRSFFPRGFLWDEGFHQLLLHKWDLALTYDVVLHWLGQVHAHAACQEMGWIPREIALGEQAKRRIPAEFLPQDVSVANPPTFLLTLERVLALTGDDAAAGKQQQQCEAEEEGAALGRRRDFLQAIQGRLDMWVRWLLNSQRGPVAGSFRWRGRGDPDEKLMATTFASGLDDYPRASEPGEEEYHVDLLCWVVKGCQILSRLAGAIDQRETSRRYATIAEELLGSLDTLHWNETLGGYFDFGLHSEDGHLDETLPVRCGDPTTHTAVDVRIPSSVLYAWDPEAPDAGTAHNTPCPPDFPAVVGLLSQTPQLSYVRGHTAPQHVPRVGYVSLFPFLLGLLPADSPRLGPVLATLRDPEQLWSPYGIRSLSKADPYYAMENAPGDAPYWRGYIWINVNYLTLRALHALAHGANPSPYKAHAGEVYTELRDNLLGTILGNYERTGYFWEQYHDVTGEGMRCHPFTGWTALVVSVMAEDY